MGMTGAELIKIAQALYGERGWQKQIAARLDVDISTVRRWVAAGEVTGPAAVALKLIRQIELRKRRKHDVDV
jgi:transposase